MTTTPSSLPNVRRYPNGYNPNLGYVTERSAFPQTLGINEDVHDDVTANASNGDVLQWDAAAGLWDAAPTGPGGGFVQSSSVPASKATAVARFDGLTGLLVEESSLCVADSGAADQFGNVFVGGADAFPGGAAIRTDGLGKNFQLAAAHNLNTEEPMGILLAESSGVNINSVIYGGGSGAVNLVTDHRFRVTAGSTNTDNSAGNERLAINGGASGGVAISDTSLGGVGVAASAALEVRSTTGGLLLPRMTTVQRNAISAPSEGLTVYDQDTDSVWWYDGGAASWKELADAAATGEANTASNQTDGGGVGIFKTKTGVDLEFHSLKPADAKLTVVDTGNDITLGFGSVAVADLSDGGTAGTHTQGSGIGEIPEVGAGGVLAASSVVVTDGSSDLATEAKATAHNRAFTASGGNNGTAVTVARGDHTHALNDLSDVVVAGATQGSIVYRDASNWEDLAPGTAGTLLQSNGAGSNPSWVAASTFGVTSVVNVGTGIGIHRDTVTGVANLHSIISGDVSALTITDAGDEISINPQLSGGDGTIADDGLVVHIAGAESVTGSKTFTAAQNAFQSGEFDAVRLGADNGAQTLTNSTIKTGGLSIPHFVNSTEEDVMLIGGQATAGNVIVIGGGVSDLNAATSTGIYAAPNVITLTGTKIVDISSTGVGMAEGGASAAANIATLDLQDTDKVLLVNRVPTASLPGVTGGALAYDSTLSRFKFAEGAAYVELGDFLRSATTTVDVSAAAAPTSGQVLTATSGTAATWQTPATMPKTLIALESLGKDCTNASDICYVPESSELSPAELGVWVMPSDRKLIQLSVAVLHDNTWSISAGTITFQVGTVSGSAATANWTQSGADIGTLSSADGNDPVFTATALSYAFSAGDKVAVRSVASGSLSATASNADLLVIAVFEDDA